MTNPMTILSFAAIFAGLGLSGGSGPSAALLTIGVFLGSAAWWVLLTTVIGIFRERITPRVMLWVNRLSGAVLVGFGIVALAVGVGAVLAPGP
jgi:threonine/homoserine/homoserine lactone efflux protein